jgi:hypothetical protein
MCAEAARAQASDAKMRGALEQRRLALLKAQADTARGERERKLAVRYHKVKFFGACPQRCASTGGCFRRLPWHALRLAPACSPAERKKIMKAQIKLRAEIEAQGWVRPGGRSSTGAALRRLLSCSARAQANAEQRAQLKQLDEDEEYVQVRRTRRRHRAVNAVADAPSSTRRNRTSPKRKSTFRSSRAAATRRTRTPSARACERSSRCVAAQRNHATLPSRAARAGERQGGCAARRRGRGCVLPPCRAPSLRAVR